jgi:cobyrinic acid a,c-diamide synthase
MTLSIPRLMLAAPASGSGKTTVTCALLQALREKGERPAALKCGPDYIDPMFHTAVTGTPARNLDLFLQPRAGVLRSLAQGCRGASLAVLEGVMGYYDGLGGNTPEAGSWHLAQVTRTPVVLVLPCRGMSPLTAAALVRGLRDFREESGLAALLLNRVSPGAFPKLKEVLERETGLPVAGFLPPLEDCTLESRHLGLVTPDALPGLRETVGRLAAALRAHADLELLLRLAREAPPLELPPLPPVSPGGEPVPVAIARDRAFSFYYPDALELLEEAGAELLPFSPLADRSLPRGAAGLLLGGGYPELFARELSRNRSMTSAIKAAIAGGMPTIAECGGFLYLHDTLADPQGTAWPMAGVIPAGAENAGRLRRFGYGTLTAGKSGLLLDAGESLPVHAFHYWQSGSQGEDFTFRKSDGRSWPEGWHTGSLYAGFPHFHFGGRPGLAERFAAACRRHQEKKGTDHDHH